MRKSWVLKKIAGRRLPHTVTQFSLQTILEMRPQTPFFLSENLLDLVGCKVLALMAEENKPEKKICQRHRVKEDIATNGLYRGMDLARGAS